MNLTQFVFIHEDIRGNVWKHIHFSYISAVKARNAWAEMSCIVRAISKRIAEQPRSVDKPMIVGRTIPATIYMED